MKTQEFPFFSTKVEADGDPKSFDLTDASQRQEYFEYKAGAELKKLREYLKENTFIVYLLGKKSSGKGTYAKMFKEIVAPDKVEHLSIGDMIRSFDAVLHDPQGKEGLIEFLKQKYRGPMPLQDLIVSMEQRSTKTLLPSELILALTEREINKFGKKVIFLDGFPRDLDQVSYSLFFKNLIDYRDDPDIFVMIDVPTDVIDQRVKSRVICPICNTSRNIRLLPTKKVEYDQKDHKFYLICDNPDCPSVKSNGARMVTKEGDELGIEPIRSRLEKDETLMFQIAKMHGIKKVFLRNSLPTRLAKEYTDEYEITPEFTYNWNQAENIVEVSKRPWEVIDNDGERCNSLMPPPVVVSLIKQLVEVLDL